MKLWVTGGYYGRTFLALITTGLVVRSTTSANLIAKSVAHKHVSSAQNNRLVTTKPLADIKQVNRMITCGEKLLTNNDWSGAYSWCERATTLLAKLSISSGNKLEIAAIRMRLLDLRNRLNKEEKISLRLDSGLKKTIEPVLSVKEHVDNQPEKCPPIGAVFDFPIDLNDKVLAWIRQFTTQKRVFMEQALSRASRYLPMVHQIFAEERVPKDLAYLAAIESGFLNSASSCAKAVGMWQFMHTTGKNYGLHSNAWIEERRDPVKATRAAAKYLRQLYMLSGDWYLALVGYNAGPKVAERAMLNLGTRNFWDMCKSHWLSDQTKNYVPELCAAILIGRFPERYGLKVEQMAPYAYETVEVNGMVNLPILSKRANIALETLKNLNPELSSDNTPPNHYLLRVPPGMCKEVVSALDGIPDDQRPSFTLYKTCKRDTLPRVAAKFKLSVDDLLSMNEMTKEQFCPGQTIKVLSSILHVSIANDLSNEHKCEKNQNLPKDVMVENSTSKLTKLKQNSIALVSNHRAISYKEARSDSINDGGFHIVKRGESLFAIAEHYGLEIKAIKKWNNIKNTEIYVGQRLIFKR